jgi:hypothetical protein
LGGGLADEPGEAGDGAAVGGFGFAEKTGFEGIVDGVEDDHAFAQHGGGNWGLVYIGVHADGGGDDDVGLDLFHFG